MSLLPDILYTDINTWNENTQTLPSIDPNTLPATPPHTHLEQSQTDIMTTWDQTPDIPAANTWGGNDVTIDDAAIAADVQAQEFAGMDINGDRHDRPPRPPRAPREYGTFPYILFFPISSCNSALC
jgi:hypothetical protein